MENHVCMIPCIILARPGRHIGIGTHVIDMGTHVIDMGTHVIDTGNHVNDMCTRVHYMGTHVNDTGTHVIGTLAHVNDMGTHVMYMGTHSNDMATYVISLGINLGCLVLVFFLNFQNITNPEQKRSCMEIVAFWALFEFLDFVFVLKCSKCWKL